MKQILKKLIVLYILIPIIIIGIFIIVVTNNKSDNYCKATFENYDGTRLYSFLIKKGSTVTYNKDLPTRQSDSNYTYEFLNWSPELGIIYEDTIYTAIYSKIEISN